MHLRFAWQALLGLGWIWWRAWALLVVRDAAALGHIHLQFSWRSLHLVTCTFVLRGRRGTCGSGLGHGRRGTWSHPLALCMAGLALGDIDRHLGMAGVALGDIDLHLGMAAVALGDIHLRFA